MASLSLDLDNEWSYLKTHGDPRWQGYPSYLDVVVPRILDLLERMQLHITFFVVGQDAALDRNRKALASISAAGHEIGNHSFHHEPWLHLYSEEEHEQEFAAAEEHIEAATGIHPVGFRGPGFSLSETTLRVLKRRRYRYDASTLPTFLGPLARAYYFMTAKLDAEERRKRKLLFGSARDGLRSIRAYKWRIGDETLLEIPVTTLPILRVPFHLSYILYLSTFSPALARAYFANALRLCQWTGTQPSLLLHPLDFLGAEDVDSLRFFPAMQLPAVVKLERVEWCLSRYAERFDVRPLGEHAEALENDHRLRLVAPNFQPSAIAHRGHRR